MPRDFGRVILNLINNAFYPVNEKQKIAGDGYEPAVIVSTSKNALRGAGAPLRLRLKTMVMEYRKKY